MLGRALESGNICLIRCLQEITPILKSLKQRLENDAVPVTHTLQLEYRVGVK